MRIVKVDLRRFRGFSSVTVLPARHVALVGEPAAGRSDLIEGLDRVFSPESTRARLPTELDFYQRDKSQRAEVEVVIADLGLELEQVFIDRLEVWDRQKHELVEELADPQAVDRDQYDLVVRLCYRAAWDEKQEQAEHWVDYPKASDSDLGRFDRVSRADRELLPFAVVHGSSRVLDLGTRGSFRRLVESSDGDDFQKAIDKLEGQIEEIAGEFSATSQMSAALEQLLAPLRTTLRLGDVGASDVVRFLPEGGSISGLMRSLGPAMNLQDGLGLLPLHRRGSTVASMLGLAQALATAGDGGVIAVDDFGEGLDAAMTQYLAAVLRRSTSQVWLSTRRPMAAEVFVPNELVRLAREAGGQRRVYQGRLPKTKRERLAARHRNLQLLPAMSSRSVVVLEGPHDGAALAALAIRLFYEAGVALPAARRVALIDAGIADGSGGSSAIPRLAEAARALGLRVVAVLDHDGNDAQAKAELEENLRSADAVLRLPPGYAIELALLEGLEEHVVREALVELGGAFSLQLPADLENVKGSDFRKLAREFIKRGPGLHAEFINVLPPKCHPPLCRRLLETAVDLAVKAADGALGQEKFIQL